jgi:hypothetical protein
MPDTSTAARTAQRKKLSRNQFEQICSLAATHSTNCEEYVCRVLANLRAWLKAPHGLERLRPEKVIETNGKNIQTCIIEIYHLLDRKCAYDFDVTEVLNFYSDDVVVDSYQ